MRRVQDVRSMISIIVDFAMGEVCGRNGIISFQQFVHAQINFLFHLVRVKSGTLILDKKIASVLSLTLCFLDCKVTIHCDAWTNLSTLAWVEVQDISKKDKELLLKPVKGYCFDRNFNANGQVDMK